MNEPDNVAPRTLVEHLRYRVDKHGQDLRELAAYVDSLEPERMDERLKVLRHEMNELKALKPELVAPAIEAMKREVGRMTAAFNRMLIAIVLSCVTIVLTILAANGRL